MLPDWQNIHRLLVIYPSSIEDVMHIQPALQILRQALPNAEITLLTTPACSQGVESWVDEIMVYEGITGNAQREINLIDKLRDRCFDAAIIFTNTDESPYSLAYICYLAGIPIRLGQSQEFGGSVLSQWVKSSLSGTHPENHHLFLLESAGFPSAQPISSDLKTVKGTPNFSTS